MNFRLTVLAISAAVVGALTVGVTLPVQAQDSKAQQQSSPQQPPTQQAEFSDSQLKSFAAAVLEVQEIRSKWQSQLQGVESAEKTQEIQTQAGAEMVTAVKNKGLTVETYNAIAVASRDNPDLAGRIGTLMEQTR